MERELSMSENREYNYAPGLQSEYNLERLYNLENYCLYKYGTKIEKKKNTDNSLRISFSVVMPVYDTISYQLCAAIESVLGQSYDNYELILIDDKSTMETVRYDLLKYEYDKHVRLVFRDCNGGISECTNTGLGLAKGDYVAFMDCDDIIEPDALFEFAKMIETHPEYDYIYSDQDCVTEDGRIFHAPFFKPDWSPELFMSEMYTNHLSVYRTDIAKNIGGFNSAVNGSQDYDFTLRFMEKSSNKHVGHISKVLYHWRERKESVAYSLESKPYALIAAEKAKADALRRNNIKGHMEYIPSVKQYRVIYEVEGRPLVSIIIYGDDSEKIEECSECVRRNTLYDNYEIITVNGSGTISGELADAGKNAAGEYLLFLKSAVRMNRCDWIEVLLAQSQQKTTGAVGAKLLYMNTSYIRHCGISIADGKPSGDFEKLDDSQICYEGFNIVNRNVTAVSMECLCVSKRKYTETGGIDKDFGRYADIALGMSLLTLGYYNVLRNDVVLYYEGESKREEKYALMELDSLSEKYPDYFLSDPFLNNNLKCYGEYIETKGCEQEPMEKSGHPVVHAEGDGRIERIGGADFIRISGYSSMKNVNEKAVARYLVIESADSEVFRVRVADVVRMDLYYKYHCDDMHLFDGFVTMVRKNNCMNDIGNCLFCMEYEYENGMTASIRLQCSEEKAEERENREIRDFVNKYKRIFIYGAGNYGNQCLNKLKVLNSEIEAIIVTTKNGNEDSLQGIKVEEFDYIKEIGNKDEIGILVALKPIFRRQVIPMLMETGLVNLFMYPTDIF